MALPLALLVLVSSVLMPPACSAVGGYEAKSHQHCLTAQHALLEVHQYFERIATPSIGRAEGGTAELPSWAFALAWFANPCAERIRSALQRNYCIEAASIVLSAPSWLLIFPFNAFW